MWGGWNNLKFVRHNFRCNSEKRIKIGVHLPKLLQKQIRGSVFWNTLYNIEHLFRADILAWLDSNWTYFSWKINVVNLSLPVCGSDPHIQRLGE